MSKRKRMSPDCTPFSEDRFRQPDSVRERDERARANALETGIKRSALDSMPEGLSWHERNGIYFVVDESLLPSSRPEWRDLPYMIHMLRNRVVEEAIPEAEIPQALRDCAQQIDEHGEPQSGHAPTRTRGGDN